MICLYKVSPAWLTPNSGKVVPVVRWEGWRGEGVVGGFLEINGINTCLAPPVI